MCFRGNIRTRFSYKKMNFPLNLCNVACRDGSKLDPALQTGTTRFPHITRPLHKNNLGKKEEKEKCWKATTASLGRPFFVCAQRGKRDVAGFVMHCRITITCFNFRLATYTIAYTKVIEVEKHAKAH